MDKKKEIDLLIEKINKWNEEYFNDDNPSVTDSIYDISLRKLAKLEKQYPEYFTEFSPTNNVGSNIINKFNKINHQKKMLSLDKAYSKDDLIKFINDVLKTTQDKEVNFYIEPKVDGLSIALHYEKGKLIKAITRGDGTVGEDVTDNVFDIIKDIPSFINYKNNIEIRGEVFITKSNFDKLNSVEHKFSNPRNMASGTLRQMNKDVVKERNLSCFVYEIISPELHDINTFSDSLLFLNKNNFKILENNLLTNDVDKIINYINDFEQNRHNIGFETDGIVIKLNNILHYDKLGFTSKFPKYNIAYKFSDELVETKLLNITLTIGRTGMATYNAQLEPVSLKGTIVSAATLHNFNYVNKLNINIGDDVMIKKAGEIIPKVFSLSKKNNVKMFPKILFCPYCNELLIDNQLETDQFCKNALCPEIRIRKIIHFVSRKGMDISGFGESWIRKFYELGIIKRFPDIYLLNKKIDEINDIPRIGKKSLDNLLQSIEESKNKNLPSVLFSLGINHLGERNCKLLSQELKSFSNFITFDLKKIESIKDIGPITLNSLTEFLNDDENIKDIKELIHLGIDPHEEKATHYNNFFTNKTFVITGKFKINRNDLKSIIEKNNGKVISAISNKTDYLICGEDFGSKKHKAETLSVKIILEEVLIDLIKEL